MSEYSLAFAERLAEAARMVAAQGLGELDAQRTVLYLGLLSTEISLKALLEQAGVPVEAIRARSHRLADLLSDLDRCQVEVEILGGRRFVPGSRVRRITLHYGDARSTVGEVIDSKDEEQSIYPGQVRYGNKLRHFPAEVIVDMATRMAEFAREHWLTIRKA